MNNDSETLDKIKKTEQNVACSFCGTPKDETPLVANWESSAFLCEECVKTCLSVFKKAKTNV